MNLDNSAPPAAVTLREMLFKNGSGPVDPAFAAFAKSISHSHFAKLGQVTIPNPWPSKLLAAQVKPMWAPIVSADLARLAASFPQTSVASYAQTSFAKYAALSKLVASIPPRAAVPVIADIPVAEELPRGMDWSPLLRRLSTVGALQFVSDLAAVYWLLGLGDPAGDSDQRAVLALLIVWVCYLAGVNPRD
jgi:hypothetical protein